MTPVERVERIEAETRGVTAQCGIKSADQVFMRGIKERRPATLSVNQEKWLADIEKRAFEEDDDES